MTACTKLNRSMVWRKRNGRTGQAPDQRRVRHRARRTGGFTLMEMVLATALALVLLAGLWGLFSTYSNLFDKGQQRVEQSQLVRSLMQQIATDLRSAIQDPIGGAPTPGTGQTPERRFGLFGTATDLRMDVLQLTPLRANATPVGGTGQSDESGTIARVPELRTIHYQLVSAAASADSTEEATSGLVRSESDFESPNSGAIESQAGVLGSNEDLAGLDSESTAFETALDTPASAADDSSLWVPEVSTISWRYFDGSSWTTQWNSIQRKSLPVAVEVQLRLIENRTASTIERPDEEILEDELLTEELSTEGLLAGTDGAQAAGSLYRLIIDLPGSPAYRKSRPTPSTQPRPARSPTRRVTPPRWTPKKQPTREPQATRGPDQWIRTDSQ